MRRRWVRWVIVVAAVLSAGAVGFFFGLPDDPQVSAGDFARVRAGMTYEQVQSIFGLERPRQWYGEWRIGAYAEYAPETKMLIWDGYEGHAGVIVDGAGVVLDKQYTPGPPETRRNPITRRLDRCRRWLRDHFGVRE